MWGSVQVLREVGEFGRWQQQLSLLFWLPPLVSGAVFLLGSFTSQYMQQRNQTNSTGSTKPETKVYL